MSITPLQFISLLTEQESDAICAAGLQSPPIFKFLLKLAASQEVLLSDPLTTGGIAAMVGAGLLTQGRADILTAVLQTDRPPPRTVAKSEAVPSNPQADGRFWVTEIYTLDDGTVSTANVLYDPGADYLALLAQHSAEMTARLAQAAS